VPLTGSDRELVVIDGTEETRIGIENSNAPVILVRTTGAPIVNGTLVITCEAPNAVLAIDGKPMKGHHSWQIVKPAGTYNITISAPGYAAKSFSEQVKAGDNVSKTITLDAVITTGVLSISNGTPQAEVLIGGAKAGDLDANGSGRFDVPFGTATVTLRRQYFEPRSFEVSASAKSPEVKLSDAKLVAFGTLNLSLAQKNVHVRYRNVNDQQFTAYTSGPVHLKQGQYEIQGEATGYQPQKRIVTISPGQNLTLPIDLPLNPPSTPDGMMQNPKAVTVVNGAWLKAKDAGEYLALLPSLRHVNLVFTKDATGFLKRAKKVHWTVEAPDGARLMYELEDRHLTRKVVAGNKDVDQKSANVDATSASVKSVYSVRVHVDPGHVRVMNDAGVVLDDYASSEHDFGSGKIAVRAETLFYVRND
jgi:hypothetical protein